MAVEGRLVSHIGNRLEHRAIEQMVAIDNRLGIAHARLRILVVHEDLAAQGILARRGMAEILVVVGTLVDRVVHDRIGDVDPAHDIRVDGFEPRPVDDRRPIRIVFGLCRVLRKLLVHLLLLLVLLLRMEPHVARNADKDDAGDEEKGREHAKHRVLLFLLLVQAIGIELAVGRGLALALAVPCICMPVMADDGREPLLDRRPFIACAIGAALRDRRLFIVRLRCSNLFRRFLVFRGNVLFHMACHRLAPISARPARGAGRGQYRSERNKKLPPAHAGGSLDS